MAVATFCALRFDRFAIFVGQSAFASTSFGWFADLFDGVSTRKVDAAFLFGESQDLGKEVKLFAYRAISNRFAVRSDQASVTVLADGFLIDGSQ